jgi:hypothetical protein
MVAGMLMAMRFLSVAGVIRGRPTVNQGDPTRAEKESLTVRDVDGTQVLENRTAVGGWP